MKPSLYGTDGDELVLYGGRCHCGFAFFPMQTYGCEQCGAFGDALTPEQFRASGVLRSSATVHHFRGEGYSAPFTVGRIALDAGPEIRVLVLGDELAIGIRMRGTLAPADDSELLDLRFEPCKEAKCR